MAVLLYSLYCYYYYRKQEHMLFRSTKLASGYKFDFTQKFHEQFLKTGDGKLLNALYFDADSPKGVILYLHGNAGSLAGWGSLSPKYTQYHYDLYMPDYRGFGKSEGNMVSEQQFYDDVQLAYNELKKKYTEDKIVVLGYSMGTGPATWLAVHNHPKQLILQAPYYSIVDLMKQRTPRLPSFVLKYRLAINEMLPHVACPVLILHGEDDLVINYHASTRLKAFLKPTDQLILFKNQDHGAFTENPEYLSVLKKILE